MSDISNMLEKVVALQEIHRKAVAYHPFDLEAQEAYIERHSINLRGAVKELSGASC